jgi:hypothetical protein
VRPRHYFDVIIGTRSRRAPDRAGRAAEGSLPGSWLGPGAKSRFLDDCGQVSLLVVKSWSSELASSQYDGSRRPAP